MRKAYIKRQKGYRKEEIEEGKGPEVDVYIDPQTGRIEMVEVRRVVEKIEDPDKEIALALKPSSTTPRSRWGTRWSSPLTPRGSPAWPSRTCARSSPSA
jgi:N utilization substance protein A